MIRGLIPGLLFFVACVLEWLLSHPTSPYLHWNTAAWQLTNPCSFDPISVHFINSAFQPTRSEFVQPTYIHWQLYRLIYISSVCVCVIYFYYNIVTLLFIEWIQFVPIWHPFLLCFAYQMCRDGIFAYNIMCVCVQVIMYTYSHTHTFYVHMQSIQSCTCVYEHSHTHTYTHTHNHSLTHTHM